MLIFCRIYNDKHGNNIDNINNNNNNNNDDNNNNNNNNNNNDNNNSDTSKRINLIIIQRQPML